MLIILKQQGYVLITYFQNILKTVKVLGLHNIFSSGFLSGWLGTAEINCLEAERSKTKIQRLQLEKKKRLQYKYINQIAVLISLQDQQE